MKHTQRDEMNTLIQLHLNRVLKNNEHIYIVPVTLYQQLQYIYYFVTPQIPNATPSIKK